MKRKIRILIGGGRIWSGETKKIDKKVISIAKENQLPLNVLFFPTSSGDRDDYINAFETEYANLGCSIYTVKLHKNKYSKQILTDLFTNSSIVYLGSGDPEAFSTILKKQRLYKHLISLLKNFNGVLVGLSAGAAMLCEGYLDLSKDDFTIKHGFGILENIILIPHYKPSEKVLNKDYLKLKDLEIACFDNNLMYERILFKNGN
jgi:peptidase E